MEDKNQNNGLTKEKNKSFSYSKLFSWIALFFSVTSPVMGIGFGILSMSLLTENDKEETKVINYIAISIAATLVLSDFVSRLF